MALQLLDFSGPGWRLECQLGIFWTELSLRQDGQDTACQLLQGLCKAQMLHANATDAPLPNMTLRNEHPCRALVAHLSSALLGWGTAACPCSPGS